MISILLLTLGAVSAWTDGSALITKSDVEIPGAAQCYRALELAIHASEKPSDVTSVYPAGWVAVPGKSGATEGAYLFNEKKPDWSTFYADEFLTLTEAGYFMDFWDNAQAIQDAAAKGKDNYNDEIRGRLANFLVQRMTKIFVHVTDPKPADDGAADPGTDLAATLKTALSGLAQAQPKVSRDEIWQKIRILGKKTLKPGERSFMDRIEGWTPKINDYNARSMAWLQGGRKGDAPAYPDGEPSEKERSAYQGFVDQVEHAGVRALGPADQKAWKAFNTPSAGAPTAAPVASPEPEIIQAIDTHFAALRQTGQEEVMDVNRASLTRGLETCQKVVKGEDRITRLADEYLTKLKATAPKGTAGGKGGGRKSGGAH